MTKFNRIIIFDLDNTLYDFKESWTIGHSEAFKMLDFADITFEVFIEVYLKFDKLLWHEMELGNLTLQEVRQFRTIKAFSEFDIEMNVEEANLFYTNMFSHLISNIVFDDKIKVLLTELKKSYRLVMLTNGLSSEQYQKIEMLNIGELFDSIYVSEEINCEKPNLEAFNHVISNEHIIKENCMMIGDSLYHDMIPAREIGIKALNWDYRYLIDNDINSIVNTINQEFEVK